MAKEKDKEGGMTMTMTYLGGLGSAVGRDSRLCFCRFLPLLSYVSTDEL